MSIENSESAKDNNTACKSPEFSHWNSFLRTNVLEEGQENYWYFSINEIFEKLGFCIFQWKLFVICGLAYMADACEVNLLTFMTVSTASEWNLSSVEKSSIASAVFAGELIGGFVWGPISDKFGRRKAFVYSLAFSIIIGFASACSTGFWMLFILRGLVGIGVAGLFVPFDVLIEMVPSSWRPFTGIYIEGFWAFGSMFVAAMAWLTIESLGWRVLTVITALPLVIAVLCYPWLPESPRWLLDQGDNEEACKVLHRIGKANGRPLPEKFTLSRNSFASTASGITRHEKSTLELLNIVCFSPELRSTTAIFSIIWFCFGFGYYGVVLFDSKVLPAPEGAKFDYMSIFITASFEFFGVMVSHLLYKLIGGRRAQTALFFVAGISTVTLSQVAYHPIQLLLLGIARGSVFGAQSILFLVTPEYYPTSVRVTAHGLCYAASRFGSIITPYWGQSEAYSLLTTTSVYCAVCLIGASLSWILPETKAIESETMTTKN